MVSFVIITGIAHLAPYLTISALWQGGQYNGSSSSDDGTSIRNAHMVHIVNGVYITGSKCKQGFHVIPKI